MSVFSSVWKGGTIEGVVFPKQSHGNSIIRVLTHDDPTPECDALVTENKKVALGIRTADCAPICFADGRQVGIAHVGWRGLCLGLIEKMLAEFDLTKLEVYVGPHLHVFEIQKDACYDAIEAKFRERFFTEEEGFVTFHFKEAIASLLPTTTLFDVRSTGTDMNLPSHRRNKTSTRLITVVQSKYL